MASSTAMPGMTPATATWMVFRVLALLVMWRMPLWHGRWGLLLLGGSSMAGGFVTVILAPSLPIMLAGFALIGIGVGSIREEAEIMGSDYPHLLGSIERSVSSIEALHIPAVEKERIFSGTALSILNNT